MVGMNAQDNWYFNTDINANAFLKNQNLAPVITNTVLQSTVQGDTIITKGDIGKGVSRSSIFGRLSYNYNEMILFNATLRRDGSSRFGANNRYGTFPSLSLGYVITKSSFMESISWLDFLKIRGSWGQNGKEPNLDYRYMATVGSSSRSYEYGTGWQTGMSPDIMPNPELKWEASQQIDIGFDSRFLQNNLTFAFDWYQKKSKDWILPVTTAGVSGIRGISTTNPYGNSGNVVNSGVEFELGYRKTFGDLVIDINGNLAYNKNKVTNVPGGIIHGSGSVIYNGSPEIYRIQEGFPIGYFWGYKTDGIFQTQEEIDKYVNADGVKLQNASPGDVKRLDLNGDGVINDGDKTKIGDPHPKYIYGLTFNAAYKGIDFSFNLAGQAGNQIVKCYRAEERTFFNYTSDIMDRWTGPGTSNKIPRVTGGLDKNNNWRAFSDLYVENAGFLKVKSITLGYDFKKLWKTMPLEQFRLYFSATNLLTFTKYTGLDPEVGYGSYYDSNGLLQDAYASGVDLGFYPTAKTYLIGLNVQF
jgi:TonB-linked SusC/RagA family outer membrane protein